MPSVQNLSPDTTLALIQAGQSDVQATAKLKDAVAAKRESDIDIAARDFEALFVAEMLKPMIESVPIDDQFGGGKGEEIFRGMMTQEYGKILAAGGGIGLASHVKEALLRAQSAIEKRGY